ncbi:hypothetical protein BDV96DRAFT_641072 [Lophiotrema nucula]|uniref:Uncharacterized protein n=1 Tax=Lophiotrema nucula TaxID=690887 RepID=A0A6A5ZQG5_9PLEO|nr:hypothetical protein BDV96DRAFT_641072 [Lophiotrema nucula]
MAVLNESTVPRARTAGEGPRDSRTNATADAVSSLTPRLTDGVSVPDTSTPGDSQRFDSPPVLTGNRTSELGGHSLPVTSSDSVEVATDNLQQVEQWLGTQSEWESPQHPRSDLLYPTPTLAHQFPPVLPIVRDPYGASGRSAANQASITYQYPHRSPHQVPPAYASRPVDVSERHATYYSQSPTPYDAHLGSYDLGQGQQLLYPRYITSSEERYIQQQRALATQLGPLHRHYRGSYHAASPPLALPYFPSIPTPSSYSHTQQAWQASLPQNQSWNRPRHQLQPQLVVEPRGRPSPPFPSQQMPEPKPVRVPIWGDYEEEMKRRQERQAKRKAATEDVQSATQSRKRSKQPKDKTKAAPRRTQHLLRSPMPPDKPVAPTAKITKQPRRRLGLQATVPSPHTPAPVPEPQQISPRHWDSQAQSIVSKYEDYKWSVRQYRIIPDMTGCHSALAWFDRVFRLQERQGIYHKWFSHTTVGYFSEEPSPCSFIVLHQAVNPLDLFGKNQTTTTIGFYVHSSTVYSEIFWKTFSPGLSMVLVDALEAGQIQTAYTWHIGMNAVAKRWHRAYWLAASMAEDFGGILNRGPHQVPKEPESPERIEDDIVAIDESYLDNTGGYDVSEEEADVIWQECVRAGYLYGQTGKQDFLLDAAVIDSSEWQD